MSTSEPVAAPKDSLRAAIQPGIQAVQENWKPFILIQVSAAILVVLYYRLPDLQTATEGIAAFKVRWGYLFSFIGGGLVCSVVPEIAKWATGDRRSLRERLPAAAFTAFVYGIITVMVDAMYRLFAMWFGTGTDWMTILKKTLLDQLIFTPLISIPLGMVLFQWFEQKFHSSAFRVLGQRDFWFHRVLGMFPLALAFWFPVLLCIYSMPSNLQLPFALIVDAAWVLIFVFVARRHASGEIGQSA